MGFILYGWRVTTLDREELLFGSLISHCLTRVVNPPKQPLGLDVYLVQKVTSEQMDMKLSKGKGNNRRKEKGGSLIWNKGRHGDKVERKSTESMF
jgi:hypothetical protein